MLIFIKYEYLSRYGDPGEELYDIKTTDETTLKEIKQEINKSFIYGDLDPKQYEIYKGGEQEDKDRNREPMTYYYTYTEPKLLDDDERTVKEYNLKDWQVLHLKPKLKIFLDIPLCGYPAIFLYTHNTLEDIQKETIKIYENKWREKLKPEQITATYGDTELEEREHLSSYKIYNYSTLSIHINKSTFIN